MTVTGQPLAPRVASLLHEAGRVYAGTPWARRFAAAERNIGGPLRIALAGRVKAGKSTLLNALVGEAVAATDAGECTTVATWYSHGDQEAALAQPRNQNGTAALPLSVHRLDGRLVVELGGRRAEELSRIEVRLPNPALAGLVVVDTPGMGSLATVVGEGAERFLTGEDDEVPSPDAVVYLMRQLHVSDADFLEAFRDPSARGIPPVNAVAVVSRADETGGGSNDALRIAQEIADQYGRDPRLRPFVQTVLPVAGLLAEASAILTPTEYEDLRALAALPASVTDELLLSAERFMAPRLYLPLEPERRVRLADRLGLFGVRWVLQAIRTDDVPDADALRRRLAEVSGLLALQDVLRSQIIGRRDVLKADAALRLVQRVVTEHPSPGGMRLVALAERLRLGMHDFAELQLLNELRLGLIPVDDELRERMEVLLGARGGSPQARLAITAGPRGILGIPPSEAGELRRLLFAEHNRWHAQAMDPLTPPALVRAAEVLQRTVEGLLADIQRSVGNPR